MADGTHTASERAELYGALRRRNRIVSLLRVLVPAICLGLLAVLGVQIVITNMTKDFTIGEVSVERGRLMVDGPTYSGALGDGSLYTVSGGRAHAAVDDPSLIDLEEARVSFTTPEGQEFTATAAVAQLDSTRQTVSVPGTTKVADNTGTSGTVQDLFIDYPGQFGHTSGPVHVRFSGGQTLDAQSMHFDATTKRWRFLNATITLTDTPGAEAP